jgi:chorismate mutase
MRFIMQGLATVVMLATAGRGAPRPRSAAEELRPLTELSARRLALAEPIALAKWDTRSPVEDSLREALVIARAVADGETRGLNPSAVSNFFRAQIEANKLVQYSLLAQWRRDGRAPAHRSIDLTTTIRPLLDRIQLELVNELANTAGVRGGDTCPIDIASAVRTYLAAHQYEVAPLDVIALDRALAETCTL